jgi:hypothetical protein
MAARLNLGAAILAMIALRSELSRAIISQVDSGQNNKMRLLVS